jgi:hypothetical protein
METLRTQAVAALATGAITADDFADILSSITHASAVAIQGKYRCAIARRVKRARAVHAARLAEAADAAWRGRALRLRACCVLLALLVERLLHAWPVITSILNSPGQQELRSDESSSLGVQLCAIRSPPGIRVWLVATFGYLNKRALKATTPTAGAALSFIIVHTPHRRADVAVSLLVPRACRTFACLVCGGVLSATHASVGI